MKHIKFTLAEPVVGIQYVPSEVFVCGPERLCVTNTDIAKRLRNMLMDLQIPLKSRSCANDGFNTIRLEDGFYFAFIKDEIFVMRGYDDIYVEDELGNTVANYDTHKDW